VGNLDEMLKYDHSQLKSHSSLIEATLNEELTTVQNHVNSTGGAMSAVDQQVKAFQNRLVDPTAPMAFVNVDGSCFVAATVHIILVIPGVARLISAMKTEPELREALLDLFHKKKRNNNNIKYCIPVIYIIMCKKIVNYIRSIA
jgi:hypothetical protein